MTLAQVRKRRRLLRTLHTFEHALGLGPGMAVVGPIDATRLAHTVLRARAEAVCEDPGVAGGQVEALADAARHATEARDAAQKDLDAAMLRLRQAAEAARLAADAYHAHMGNVYSTPPHRDDAQIMRMLERSDGINAVAALRAQVGELSRALGKKA